MLQAPVLHIDDLCAGWAGLREVPARVVEWILMPLAASQGARYRRYDWERKRYVEWIDVPDSDNLIVEGVMSGSLLAAPYLSMLIWVTAPEATRLERGIRRDGESSRDNWIEWIREERELFDRERTLERAAVLVDGAPQQQFDVSASFVPLSRRRP